MNDRSGTPPLVLIRGLIGIVALMLMVLP